MTREEITEAIRFLAKRVAEFVDELPDSPDFVTEADDWAYVRDLLNDAADEAEKLTPVKK